LLAERVLDADLDVVEVDEYCDVQSFLVGCQCVPSVRLAEALAEADVLLGSTRCH
jgi:hypothetical protein